MRRASLLGVLGACSRTTTAAEHQSLWKRTPYKGQPPGMVDASELGSRSSAWAAMGEL